MHELIFHQRPETNSVFASLIATTIRASCRVYTVIHNIYYSRQVGAVKKRGVLQIIRTLSDLLPIRLVCDGAAGATSGD